MSSALTPRRQRLPDLHPELQPGLFVFCSVSPKARKALKISPIAEFLEAEGVTLVLRLAEARRMGLSFQFPCRLITLRVPTALDAVGVLAALSGRLAEAGIGLNAFSGYHHDHLFVPEKRADAALALLQAAA